VSHRPLVFVSGLTVGDYLLWNWSLNGGQDVLALVAGLTLPPLLVACLWLLALSLARLLARHTRRPARTRRREAAARQVAQGPAQTSTAAPLEEPGPSTRTPAPSSGRLAA
jgi:HAMP domain-containing protein